MCDNCRERESAGEVIHRQPATAAPAPEHPVLGLQRAAGNRAVGRMLARDPSDVRRPSRLIPESPTLNIFALQNQALLAGEIRRLRQEEKDVARTVFGESVDLERVRIAVTSVLSAPTTLGNTIRSRDRDIERGVLIHELTHVWQYQTSGLRYISCALAGQIQGTVAHGDRNWTYEFDRTRAGTRFDDYGPEQQAFIIETAFREGKLEDPAFFGPMVATVRRARPRPDDPGFDMSEAAGLTGPRRLDPTGPLAPDPRSEEMGGTVPQFQWRF
jgi:hypothetical protein